jgi:hypothetical protein
VRLRFYHDENIEVGNGILWSTMMIQLIHQNYDSMTVIDLASALGVAVQSTRMKLYELGYKKMEMEYWTDQQVQFLMENYTMIGDVEMAEIFQVFWPKGKTWSHKHIEKKRKYLNLYRTEEQIAAVKQRNKDTGRWAECAVKRWKVSHQAVVGEVRIWNRDDGFGKFKVIKTKNGFVHYAPWLWEKYKGKIPTGMLVGFRDYDNMNVVIENLALYTRAEHARRYTMRFPPELKKTIKAYKQLVTIIKEKQDGKG